MNSLLSRTMDAQYLYFVLAKQNSSSPEVEDLKYRTGISYLEG